MFNSKAMKEGFGQRYMDEDPDPTHNKFQKAIYALKYWLKYDVYYKIEGKFYMYHERITRSWAFAKHGWLSYDFDAHTIYPLLAFKLKRVKAALLVGHAIQEEEDMKALDEAITISERLSEDDYDWDYLREHDKKWGEIESDHIPNLDSNGKVLTYTWLMTRKGTTNVSPEVEAQETKEFRNCWEKGQTDRHNDVDRLGVLLRDYLPKWWD